ncbi:MAG TPA: hypothetical protein VE709_13120 [Pseudonocardiaceae bacterium]|nr:hypothetical protein [Pseudonocardiaceae bacterium]
MSREQIMRKLLAPAVLRSTLVGVAAALALSALALSVLALSGCAAGQITQTDAQVAAVNGASGDVGPIALRDVVLAYPGGEDVFGYAPGDEAPLLLTIINSGTRTEELVSVSTPAAGEVVVDGMTTIPGGFVVSSIDDARTRGSSSAGDAADRMLGIGELRIVLTDLTGPIRPGLPTFVTFRFREAGEVTLRVPIDAPAETLPEPAEDSPPGDEQSTGEG